MSEFVDSSKRAVAKMFPTLLDNPDYTSVVNARHFERISGYVDEAKERGVEVVEINPANEDFRQQSAHYLDLGPGLHRPTWQCRLLDSKIVSSTGTLPKSSRGGTSGLRNHSLAGSLFSFVALWRVGTGAVPQRRPHVIIRRRRYVSWLTVIQLVPVFVQWNEVFWANG